MVNASKVISTREHKTQKQSGASQSWQVNFLQFSKNSEGHDPSIPKIVCRK